MSALEAEYRRQLLLLNRERIELAYVKARAKGLDDPIILVLDLQDDGAARLAQLTGMLWDQIERLREECGYAGIVPTQVLALPRGAVLCVVSPAAPNGSRGIAQLNPPGTFRVVAIASSGNSFADFPAPPVCCVDQIGD